MSNALNREDYYRVEWRDPKDDRRTVKYVHNDEVLVTVSPEVARLIEAVGADNLPALLRVTYYSWIDGTLPKGVAITLDVAERLGEALDGEA